MNVIRKRAEHTSERIKFPLVPPQSTLQSTPHSTSWCLTTRSYYAPTGCSQISGIHCTEDATPLPVLTTAPNPTEPSPTPEPTEPTGCDPYWWVIFRACLAFVSARPENIPTSSTCLSLFKTNARLLQGVLRRFPAHVPRWPSLV